MKKKFSVFLISVALLGGCTMHGDISSSVTEQPKTYQLFEHKEGETELDNFYN